MLESNRSLSTVLAIGIVLLAIAGYVLGTQGNSGPARDRSPGAQAEQRRSIFAGSVLLESAAGWRPVLAAPQLPGLTVIHPMAFAPGGDPIHAGLLTGQLPGGEASPLPLAFLGQLSRLPESAVVSLAQAEAYRYANVSLSGFHRQLALYVIPNPGGNPTVLACYAEPPSAADMATCEQIVASVRPVGQRATETLTPDPSYAHSVSATIAALDGLRLTLRGGMRPGATFATVKRYGARLAQGFAAAAASLARLEPSLALGQAHAALTRALGSAQETYTALSAAAAARSVPRYRSARAQVVASEAQVDLALQTFALLGYRHS